MWLSLFVRLNRSRFIELVIGLTVKTKFYLLAQQPITQSNDQLWSKCSKTINYFIISRKMIAQQREPSTCLSSFRFLALLRRLQWLELNCEAAEISSAKEIFIPLLIAGSYINGNLNIRKALCIFRFIIYSEKLCKRHSNDAVAEGWKAYNKRQRALLRSIGNLFKSKWSRIERNDLFAWYAK